MIKTTPPQSHTTNHQASLREMVCECLRACVWVCVCGCGLWWHVAKHCFSHLPLCLSTQVVQSHNCWNPLWSTVNTTFFSSFFFKSVSCGVFFFLNPTRVALSGAHTSTKTQQHRTNCTDLLGSVINCHNNGVIRERAHAVETNGDALISVSISAASLI